jgi:hypothetical protein
MAEADLELKYAHLGHKDTPKRKANPEHLQEMIAEIQAEQEQKNAALAARATDPTRLGVARRYAKGIAHPSGREEREE